MTIKDYNKRITVEQLLDLFLINEEKKEEVKYD